MRVPEVLPELSTGRLLTMTWLDGRPLLELVDAPQEVRDRLARNMFRAWYVPFYDYAVLHGDPHLGNYSACPDQTINLIDFGCIRVFKPALVQGVIDLYWALVRGDRDLAVHAYETWGFSDLRKDVIDTLNLWAAFIYAPLMEDRPRLIEETNSGAYGREVAFNVQKRLREIGGVTPPREFVLMDRAAIGLGSVFMHLKAEVNWHQLFMGLIQDFDVDRARAPPDRGASGAGPALAELIAPTVSPAGRRPATDPAYCAMVGGLSGGITSASASGGSSSVRRPSAQAAASLRSALPAPGMTAQPPSWTNLPR